MPSPRAWLSAVVLLCASPLATGSDLLIDGVTDAVVMPGATTSWSITGTPGATAFLLFDTSPGPTTVFGQELDLGFTPALVSIPLPPIPIGGELAFDLTLPDDAGVDGQTLHTLLAVVEGQGPADYDYSPGASVTAADVKAQLAGRTLAGYPHFDTVRAFNQGTSVWMAVDPSLRPALVDETVDLYVTAPRTRAQWLADPTLVDVTVSGADTLLLDGADISANTFLVDAGTLSADNGTTVGRGYDLVLDVDQDGLLGVADLIDGLGDEAGFYLVHDVTQPGPLAVTEATYSGGTWLGQNLFYPTGIAGMGTLPLVVMSHGNGHNYQWYDHIGTHLASYGFIVMSHQNNTVPGIETASTTTLTNTDYFLGNLDIIEGGLLEGHVDTDAIAWIGHSRGGEGVARAYDRIVDGAWTPGNYVLDDIQLVSSIAPTDFLGTNSSNPHDVDYHLWVGGADNDVSGCASNNIVQSFHLHDRAEQKRMSISLHGVGHGDFHNASGSVAAGPCLVGKSSTHTIMRGHILPLMAHHLRGNVPSEDFLTRQWESFRPIGAPDANPCVVVDLQYREGDGAKFVIDDLQGGIAGVSSSGGGVTQSVAGARVGRMDDPDTNFTYSSAEHFNGFTNGSASDSTRGMVFQYDFPGAQLAWEVVPAARDVTPYTYLSLRACQVTRHPFTTAELGDLTFTAVLVDGAGTESAIDIGVYGGGLEEPYQRGGCGTGNGWANEFETIRVRLTDFLHDGSGLDLTDIVTVALRFGPGSGSDQGRLGLDDLEFTGD